MCDKSITTKCDACCSENISFIQDNHHKMIDGAHWGIMKCGDCGDIRFWFLKVKAKVKVETNVINVKSDVKFAKIAKWDGPISQFIWGHIEDACKTTGKIPTDYYVTYI